MPYLASSVYQKRALSIRCHCSLTTAACVPTCLGVEMESSCSLLCSHWAWLVVLLARTGSWASAVRAVRLERERCTGESFGCLLAMLLNLLKYLSISHLAISARTFGKHPYLGSCIVHRSSTWLVSMPSAWFQSCLVSHHSQSKSQSIGRKRPKDPAEPGGSQVLRVPNAASGTFPLPWKWIE